MLNTVPQVVDVTVFKSLALLRISLNTLILGLAAGLNAGSFTVIVSLAGLLSKSIAPPAPADPVKKPERVASVP